MPRYSQKAQKKIEETMKEYKQGKLKSGKSNRPVKSRKQAVAIGISQAKKKGYKVPTKKK